MNRREWTGLAVLAGIFLLLALHVGDGPPAPQFTEPPIPYAACVRLEYFKEDMFGDMSARSRGEFVSRFTEYEDAPPGSWIAILASVHGGSGGGIFAKNGFLVGVHSMSDSTGTLSIFVRAEEIARFLDECAGCATLHAVKAVDSNEE